MFKFPPIVYLQITSKCNHNCLYCYGPKNIKDLSFSESKKLFYLLHNNGVRAIVLCGGEPLIRKDIIKVFKELKKYNFKIFLDTNGDYLFKYQKEIEKYVDSLGLPLDFSNASLTSNYRGKRNFNNVIKILDCYRDNDKPFLLRVGTVATQDNINDIEKLADLLKEKNIDIWKIYEFTPLGLNGKLNQNKLIIRKERFNKLTKLIKQKYSKHFKIIIAGRNKRNRAYFLIDPSGMAFIHIDDYSICENIILGNIFDNKIIKRWEKLVRKNNYKANILETFNYKI